MSLNNKDLITNPHMDWVKLEIATIKLQYPVERYVGIQDCHIRDWQPARQPTIPSSDAEGNRELTCIYFSKESSTLAKVLKVYTLVATVCRT